MNIIDIILKKKHGEKLSEEEISYFVNGYAKNEIPDYQISPLLMAICFNGMDKEEISILTKHMMHSGEVVDLSAISGKKVDKHSTGGVGDKTTLVLTPLVAACGGKVAKMSGRGLGHTGGTLDKLESIPGFNISLTDEEFKKQVNDIGIAVIGQTANLVPADKKLYALRDVTGTVDSIPLIASSIMSKKLATGSDCILLDVKFGSGAFFVDPKDSRVLAKTMVDIGNSLGRNTKALLTNMDEPLGMAIGNILEVKEAVNTLLNKGPKDLYELCLEAGSIMLVQGEICKTKEEAQKMLLSKLEDGSAFNKLCEFVEAQGGDSSYIKDLSKFPVAKHAIEVKASEEGYLNKICAIELGEASCSLGAGRRTKDDVIDYTAGIVLNKKCGDLVKKGDLLATVYTNHDNYDAEIKQISDAFTIGKEKGSYYPTIYDIVE